jgi:hypothetical protein
MLNNHPASRSAPGIATVTAKGLSGEDTETFFVSPGLELTLIRPARKDELAPRPFSNWLRQRIEAIIWRGQPRIAGRAGASRPTSARLASKWVGRRPFHAESEGPAEPAC